MAKKQRMTQYLYFVLDILIVPNGSSSKNLRLGRNINQI